MPELPEVETVKRTLAPILGAEIRSVWGSGKALRLGKEVDLSGLRRVCTRAPIEAVRRLGKYLLIDLEGKDQSILVHLGMSGRLRFFDGDSERPKHTHIEWSLQDGRVLRFTDPRRFGQVELVGRDREREHPSLAKLGPDPVTDRLDPRAFHEACGRTKRAIKVAILDQQLVAGVGNIYASEALWQARIHPKRAASSLSRERASRLASAITDVMERALEHGGTSLKDFVDADGHAGEHSHYLWVYDQEGEDCRRKACDGRIRRFVQGQRATFYCPRCQR